MRTILLPLVACLASCGTLGSDDDLAPPGVDPWSASFEPPRELDTERLHLEPLAPEHTELDFAALMGSREHLRSTLHWGSWPREDFTVEENREDLQRHGDEFEAREAYAYTVLAPDRSRCVGCVYMNPAADDHPRTISLAYWVIASELENDLDEHLLASVLEWIERDWPFDEVLVPVHAENARGHGIARARGLADAAELHPELQARMTSHALYAWVRD